MAQLRGAQSADGLLREHGTRRVCRAGVDFNHTHPVCFGRRGDFVTFPAIRLHAFSLACARVVLWHSCAARSRRKGDFVTFPAIGLRAFGPGLRPRGAVAQLRGAQSAEGLLREHGTRKVCRAGVDFNHTHPVCFGRRFFCGFVMVSAIVFASRTQKPPSLREMASRLRDD